MAAEANWYDLKRATPTFEPPQKDRWCTLATNPREALQYFERELQLACRLDVCEAHETDEFILEKRALLQTNAGLQPGKALDAVWVRRGGRVRFV
jgi:hypothetical protein